MRIALFGGTFDPPHRGHLSVARASAVFLSLEEVLFVPTGRQPLKLHGSITTPYESRFAMVELLCAGADKRFAASRLEEPGENNGPNYTIDTLRRFRTGASSAEVFVIVGADSFLDIRRWREPDALLAIAEWIVVSRPGFSLAELGPMRLTQEQRGRVHLLETVHEEVSATEIRRRIAAGEDCSELLTPEIAEYIEQHRLYRKR